MRRDMDLIRLLLLEKEGEVPVDLSGFSEDQIGYHKYLLVSANLATGPISETGSHPTAILVALTSEGHDFLEASRNETVWKKALSRMKDLGGVFALDVVKALLISVSKNELGLN